MAHVTFIHGLANKPAADLLHPIWKRALAKNDGFSLDDEGVTSTMVYWADVLYPQPDGNLADHESEATDARLAKLDGAGAAGLPVGATADERHFIAAMRERDVSMDEDKLKDAGDLGVHGEEATPLERVPLPWWIKKRIMEAKIRDAYLYLFDKEFSPRPGVTYRVREEIRSRFMAALKVGAAKTGPHVVVSHSMGTMVAYDCLKRVTGCPAIDALITMGSPLGIDEVQDCYAPEWTRRDGYPAATIKNEWVNFLDHLDVVCGADPKLANDFRYNSNRRIRDIRVSNDGAWRHSVVKYFAQESVRGALRRLLHVHSV